MELGNRLEAVRRSRRTRLQYLSEPRVERRNRDRYRRGSDAGQLCERIRVPGDQVILCYYKNRVAELRQYLQTRPSDVELSFDRLVGVRYAAQGEMLRNP